MFGLPMSTTLIMGGVMLFWVVYTLIFFMRTKDWNYDDADYDGPGGGPGPDAPAPDGGTR